VLGAAVRCSRQRSKPNGRDAASEGSGETRLGAQHESAATPEAAGQKRQRSRSRGPRPTADPPGTVPRSATAGGAWPCVFRRL